MQRLPGNVLPVFSSKLREWLLHGFADFVKTQSEKFLAATDAPLDGATLRFTIEHPQGLKELGQTLVERGPSGSKLAETIGKGSLPNVRVEVFPGHKCD